MSEDQYYIQERRSTVGNSILWWRPNGAGYTTKIDDAGVYSPEYAYSQHECRSSDVPWLKSYVDSKSVRHVDSQRVNRIEHDRVNGGEKT